MIIYTGKIEHSKFHEMRCEVNGIVSDSNKIFLWHESEDIN